MNLTIIGVIPWREAMHSTFIVSDLMQRLYGSTVAQVMTGLILFTTFASLFAVLLGYSRVPFAAATDGRFFRVFGRLHRTKNFPYFSVAFIGISSAFASLLNLSDLITALIVIQVLVQFMAQVVAVTLIRRYRPDIRRPFQMWLYPVTSIIAFAGWGFILAASGLKFILWGLALTAFGIGAYLWRARTEHEWPFERAQAGVAR
jgi:amino acid transporter